MLGSDITVAMVNAALTGTWRCRAITRGGEAQLDGHRADRTLTVLLGGDRADVLAAIPILLPTLETLLDTVSSAITVEVTLSSRRPRA